MYLHRDQEDFINRVICPPACQLFLQKIEYWFLGTTCSTYVFSLSVLELCLQDSFDDLCENILEPQKRTAKRKWWNKDKDQSLTVQRYMLISLISRISCSNYPQPKQL